MSLNIPTVGASTYARSLEATPAKAALQVHPLLANKALMDNSPYFANLTATDLEVVYQATGVRMDENTKTFPIFAVVIAMDRESGGLPAGQDISTDYLTKMLHQYTGQADAGWISQIQKGLDYLAGRGGQPGINVLA